MADFPIILRREVSGDRAELDLALPPGLIYFDGHFDGLPVLPGVVQLHWAIRCARDCLPVGAAEPLSMQVKFRRLIRPESRLRLTLALASSQRGVQLSFLYDCEGERCSSGRLDLAAQ